MRHLTSIIVLLVAGVQFTLAQAPPCCSWTPGERVRLLVANPQSAANLPANSCGTVVWCDSQWTGPDALLVDWDGWSWDNAGTPDSTWWVACDEVVQDAACQAMPMCGDGVCDAGENCPADCPVVACGLNPGDQVTLAVSNPNQAVNLPAGSLGVVVCTDPTTPDLSLFVSWDNWNDGTAQADCIQNQLPSDSGWWVSCADLDLCPADPAKTAPGACGCGAADTDSDGDGTPDCHEAPPNQAPVAANQTVNVTHNAPQVFTLVAADVDVPAQALTYAIVTGPTHGTVSSLNAATAVVTYTPNAGFSGADAFTFTASDGVATSAPATVSITVASAPPTQPPPAPDADGDSVPDATDNCVNAANADQADADGDGAGDACDSCPNDAQKLEPGSCGCGQADTPGCGATNNDACPDDANKTEPGVCGCGVAEIDSDGDGVPDCVDDSTDAGADKPDDRTDLNQEAPAAPQPFPLCGAGFVPMAGLSMFGLALMRSGRRRRF